MTNDYLVHHGILGQRWGIRRYQPYSVVPRGSGEGGKEIGEAAEKKRRKNIARGEKRLTKRLNYLARKSKRLDTDLGKQARFDTIKYDQAIKATKEILSNEARTERVGKVTKRQTALNIGSTAAAEALIIALLGEMTVSNALVPAVLAGSVYVQSLINK